MHFNKTQWHFPRNDCSNTQCRLTSLAAGFQSSNNRITIGNQTWLLVGKDRNCLDPFFYILDSILDRYRLCKFHAFAGVRYVIGCAFYKGNEQFKNFLTRFFNLSSFDNRHRHRVGPKGQTRSESEININFLEFKMCVLHALLRSSSKQQRQKR